MSRLSLIVPAAAVVLVFLLTGPGGAGGGDPAPRPVEDGGGCTNGCSLSKHDLPTLEASEFRDLLAAYAAGPLDETNAALETLLFHGDATVALLETRPPALPEEHARFLARELARRHARIELRVIDVDGRELVRLDPTTVTLGVKAHVHPTRSSLPPLEFSGTVKRVGLYHLWTRL